MTARLLVRDIGKSFGATRALDGVTLCAQAGEIHAVLGENGAGKSTLMNILAGSLSADRGFIEVDGAPYRPRSPKEARNLGVAMVHQELALCPHLSVLDNLMLGQENARWGWLDRKTMKTRASDALHLVVGPEARSWLDQSVGTLSVASQQLIEIARALVVSAGAGASDCRLLILDEPTSSLGRQDTERLFEILRRLRNQGHTILYISHFLEEIRRIADRFTILRDGATVGEGVVAEVSVSDMVRAMAGRRVEQRYLRSERRGGPVALTLDRVAGLNLPKQVSLHLHYGEVLGIAGWGGAGRSELLRSIFGLEPIRSGTIKLGAFVGPASPAHRLAHGLGMLSEDRKNEGLAANLSVMDNLTLSRLPLHHGLVLAEKQRQVAERWLEQLRIKCSDPCQPISRLSGGNQQKVALARLLHHDVDVLLLDEPTRGIDIGSKEQIFERIDAVACGGKAVLMVSSVLSELLGVCDRIGVMHRGVLETIREAEQWTEEELLQEALGATA